MKEEEPVVIDSLGGPYFRFKGPNPVKEFFDRRLNFGRRIRIRALKETDDFIERYTLPEVFGFNEIQTRAFSFHYISYNLAKEAEKLDYGLHRKEPSPMIIISPVFSPLLDSLTQWDEYRYQVMKSISNDFRGLAETQEAFLMREITWQVLAERHGKEALLFGRVDIDRAAADPDVLLLVKERLGQYGSHSGLRRLANIFSSSQSKYREKPAKFAQQVELIINRELRR